MTEKPTVIIKGPKEKKDLPVIPKQGLPPRFRQVGRFFKKQTKRKRGTK